jgi:hypothetical protein
MMRLHPETGVIISWKPDCSLQVMIVIKKGKKKKTRSEIIIRPQFDQDCLIMHLSPSAPILPLFKHKAHVRTPQMLKCLLCFFPCHVLRLYIINFLPLLCHLHICLIGVTHFICDWHKYYLALLCSLLLLYHQWMRTDYEYEAHKTVIKHCHRKDPFNVSSFF